MMGHNFVGTLAIAVLLLTTPRITAQSLSLEIDLGDLETWISNNTALAIASDGYQIVSPSGILDPVNWRSIDDAVALDPAAVTAALGSGALSFTEGAPTSTHLTEFDVVSTATWPPGTRWSLGFPFGTSLAQFQSRPFDAHFEYTSLFGSVIAGSIEFIPEPATLTFVVTALVGLVIAGRRRN